MRHLLEGFGGDPEGETQPIPELIPPQVELRLGLVKNIAKDRLERTVA